MKKSRISEVQFPIAVVGSASEHTALAVKYLGELGIGKIQRFNSGSDFIEIARMQNFSFAFLFSDIKETHWSNFLRKIRTDETIPFIPICLILEGEDKIENVWNEIIDNYKIRETLFTPLKKDDVEQAIVKSQSEDKNSSSVQMLLKIARRYFQEGLNSQAKSLYENILQSEGKNLVAYSGLLHTERENIKAFQKHIETVLKLDPENYCFKFELMSSHLRSNHLKEFNDLINEMMSDMKKEKEGFWLTELADICLQMGFSHISEKIANYVLSEKPTVERWRQYIVLARSQLSEGRIDDAKKYVDKAMKSCPTPRADVFNFQGVVLNKKGYNERAIEFFKKAISITPMDKRLYFNIAISYISLKQYDNAVQSLNKALDIDSGYVKAQNLKSKIYTKVGDKLNGSKT